MTGLSFSRGGYSRYGAGRPAGERCLHGLAARSLGIRRDRPPVRRRAGLADAIVGYEVDGCDLTLVDGLPVPTHEDGAPGTLAVLATAPARFGRRTSNPRGTRTSPASSSTWPTALFGDEFADANVHRIAAQPRGGRMLRRSRRRHGVQRRMHGLDLRDRGRRSRRRADHEERPRPSVGMTPVGSTACAGTSSPSVPGDRGPAPRNASARRSSACWAPSVPDGTPRISPCELDFAAGHLILGMMWQSRKALDLLRDPRCVLHTCTTDRMGTEGDAKIYAPRGRRAGSRSSARPTGRP